MINYNQEMENLIKDFNGNKTLLLHSCCGPCSTAVITRLKEHFDITVFFYNPCLYPNSEYEKRLNEQIKFAEIHNIKVLSDYNDSDFNNAISGYEHMGEKSIRCYKCYELRLEKTAKKASELNFDYFTTTLSISPYKLAKWINKIGYELEEKYNVKYLYSDFKKESGYQHSISLSKEYNLYNGNNASVY
jgi:predicted adenine nucleotide alpha hydrolase (AANH) superfamily ATPase